MLDERTEELFQQEAAWIADFLYVGKPHGMFPMINVGSSTADFRVRVQPWIDAEIFAPARKAGLKVIHMDIKEAPGVDVVGDLTDFAFCAQLSAMNIQSALCSNLLEHVTNKEQICLSIEQAVRPGGHIIVTAPYQYPYHGDPIDTLFRPTPVELAALFPNSTVVRSSILDCGNYIQSLLASPKAALWNIARLCLPFYKTAYWRELLGFHGWLFRTFQVSCVVLKKHRWG